MQQHLARSTKFAFSLDESVADFDDSGECDGTYSYVYILPYLDVLNTLPS